MTRKCTGRFPQATALGSLLLDIQVKQQRCSFTSGPRGKGGLHSLQSLSLLALILQLAKPHSQGEIKILVTELSLQPKVNGQTCLHTPKSPCSLSRAISHRKRQTETSVLSSCQTLHHSLDLSSVLPLLCSSRDSGRLFWKSSTREQFHTCVHRYIKVFSNTQKLGLGALHYQLVKGQWRPPNMAFKQTQTTGHILKITPSST